MSKFEEYANKYETARLERRDGILQLTLHHKGGPYVWSGQAHTEIGEVFRDIGADRDNRVVIITGTGDAFLNQADWASMGVNSVYDFERINWETKQNLQNLLDIQAPIIGAINGPATIHAELAALSDIVLASDTATFQDFPHFPTGTVPGDGVNLVWPLLLGLNRGRYFLLTGQVLSAKEALDLGVVNEILPPDKLLPRAWELAGQLAKNSPLTLRYTREVLNLQLKRLVREDLPYTFALEMLASLDRRG